MLMRSMPWYVFFALVTGTNVSHAQVPADSLIAGDLVQYELSEPLDDLPEESKGTFEALTSSVVMLSAVEDVDDVGLVELPRELLLDFEVARGTKDIRWPGGVVVGIAGCVVGHAVVKSSNTEDDMGAAFVGCPLGFVAGGIIGYLVGSQITGPRWEDVEFD